MSESLPGSHDAFLSRVPIFNALSEEEVSEIAQVSVALRYQFGQTILSQGSHCDGLYLIFSGSVRLFVEESGNEISLGLRKAGDVFAEVPVLRNAPVEYTVRATAECEILKIPRSALTALWDRNPKIEGYMVRYAAVKTTGGLVARLFDLKIDSGKKAFESIIETIGIKRVDPGYVVLRQDTFDDRRLYVIRQGSVRVVRQEGDFEFEIAVLEKGETFGERALLYSDNQPATVIAESSSTFLMIPDSTVNAILDDHPALRASFEERICAFECELERQRKLAGRKAGRWLFSPEARAGTGEKILHRFPLVEQEEEMDCGAACLAMICRYYGIQTTLEQLRDLADIDCRGATLESLAVAGERLGFIARGVSATFGELLDFELPVLVHWQGYHYIVIYGVSGHQVNVADPALGFNTLTRTEFEKGWDGTCLLLERDRQSISGIELEVPKPGASRFFKPVRPWILPVVALAVFSGLLAVALSLLMRNVLDGVPMIADLAKPGFLALGFFALFVFASLAKLLSDLFIGMLKHGVAQEATSDFIQRILYQPLAFFEKRKVSDFIARYKDQERFWMFCAEQGVELQVSFWIVVFTWIALIWIDLGLAGLYIGIHLLVPVVLRFGGRQKSRIAANVPGDASQALHEMFEGIETIKSRGAEYWVRCRWESLTAAQDESSRRNLANLAILNFATRIVQSLALSVLLWKGMQLYFDQQLSAGGFAAVFLLAAGSFHPVGRLVAGWMEWRAVQPGLHRVRSISRMAPEQGFDQVATNIVLPDLKGVFRVHDLYFRYQQHSPYVIEGLNFQIEPGQWIYLIGPAESGKTTISKLLMGLYPVREGRIEIDGYSISLLEIGSYRRQIGYLPQKPFLISGTVADNIALGIRAPERKRIVEVCRLTGLDEFVGQLPGGYDCPISEVGGADSRGWLQRLGAARALYRRPAVLIFDEALSGLELKEESDILHVIRDAYPNITMITLTKRVNPDLKPDRVFMLYHGRIAESGAPEDLLERNGLYEQSINASETSL